MALCFLDTLKTQPLWVLVLCILGSLSIFKWSLRCLNWVYVNFLGLAKNLKKYESSALASSSSSSVAVQVQQKFQVFLSFRGEDTRNNFTSHLHAALKRKGIDTYIDDRLEKGKKIETLFTTIEESTISIIVLSKNYASSTWCLDELSKILECKKTMGQKVVPIFYHVDPSDVRYQKGSFEVAFAKHQQRFKDETDKVEKWRAALKEVANLSGYHIQPHLLESTLIAEIIKNISKKLKYKSLCHTKHLVGIDSHIKKFESLLCIDSVDDVRIIGISGMGGLGKTTTAEAVYIRFFDKFEGHCFVNVKEKLNFGQVHLREELFSKILEDGNLSLDTSLLPPFIKERLQCKKIFIVLDDVNDSMQLLDLLPEKDCFGPGSRIIIISRDKQVFQRVVDETYEVKGMVDDEALQLFSMCAFKQSHPREDFVKLSEQVIHFAKGVPLALSVVGCALNGKRKDVWEGHLIKLQESSDPKIDEVLKISYDGLEDDMKGIFLDIACFFRGKHMYEVENILDGCYTSVMSSISFLIDKSLITVSYNMLGMHDLLQLMAWNIIRQESKEPGKRSRLWTPRDIYHVLKNNTGTDKVEGMLLDMSKIRNVHLNFTAFERMYNLKFLKFYYADFQRERERKVWLSEQGLESLPDNLRLLHWDDYPLKCLPHNFCSDNLVELCMCNSHIKTLWNRVQNLVNLKRLDLKGSHHLMEIPDLSSAITLESLNLDGCESLVGVHSSIRCLSKLKFLYMRECRGIEELPSSIEHLVELKELYLDACEKLKNLPSSIRKLKSLETLSLSDCSNITKFPEILGNLKWLSLSGTAIEQVPSSIESLSQLWNRVQNFVNLKWLNLKGLHHLMEIPDLSSAITLESINLDGCESLVGVHSSIGHLSKLKDLFMRECREIEELPSSIEHLVGLKRLYLVACEKLKNLPSSISMLKSLESLSLCDCSNITKFPEIPENLKRLSLSGTAIEQVPSSIECISQLELLFLDNCCQETFFS